MIRNIWNVEKKYFPTKRFFFSVQPSSPSLPSRSRPYKFIWTLTTLEGINYYYYHNSWQFWNWKAQHPLLRGGGRGEGEEELILGKLGFVGFAKYPKVVQHRAMACWKQLDIPTKNMGGTILAPTPLGMGRGKAPPRKKIFFWFILYFFSERGWSAHAKKNFLFNFIPHPPPWGGVKVEKFRFLKFAKYPKVLQHRAIAL